MSLYRKTALLEVLGRDVEGGYIVQNQGNDSDIWTIPCETFESTYEEVK